MITDPIETEVPLVLHPDARLTTPCKEVAEITPDLKELASGMLGLVERFKGYGLAANQAGDDRRLIVYELEKGRSVSLANPKIVSSSEQKVGIKEGCLSFLGVMTTVSRAAEVEVEGIDVFTGKETRFTSENPFEAAVIQHEIDHLDGVLFIDLISGFRRRLLLKHYRSRVAKLRQQEKRRRKASW